MRRLVIIITIVDKNIYNVNECQNRQEGLWGVGGKNAVLRTCWKKCLYYNTQPALLRSDFGLTRGE